MQLDGKGRKTGFWEEPDPRGRISSGDYVAGECVWFRQGGGLLQTGAFLDGEKHGLWKRWTAAGILIDEGHFDRGTKSGTWTYYAPDGSVKKTTNHRVASSA